VWPPHFSILPEVPVTAPEVLYGAGPGSTSSTESTAPECPSELAPGRRRTDGPERLAEVMAVEGSGGGGDLNRRRRWRWRFEPAAAVAGLRTSTDGGWCVSKPLISYPRPRHKGALCSAQRRAQRRPHEDHEGALGKKAPSAGLEPATR
jgi:hypothetical protein